MSVLLRECNFDQTTYVRTYMYCEDSYVLCIIHAILAVLDVWACTSGGI